MSMGHPTRTAMHPASAPTITLLDGVHCSAEMLEPMSIECRSSPVAMFQRTTLPSTPPVTTTERPCNSPAVTARI